ncbi:MAG: hypothetical protein K2Y08_00595 [Alphaproteobacteria bacterium]|nr:hypothetical protein [Alphaproteobacteria bacterium]
MLKKFLRTSGLTLGASLCALVCLQNEGHTSDLFLDNMTGVDLNCTVSLRINRRNMTYTDLKEIGSTVIKKRKCVLIGKLETFCNEFNELALYENRDELDGEHAYELFINVKPTSLEFADSNQYTLFGGHAEFLSEKLLPFLTVTYDPEKEYSGLSFTPSNEEQAKPHESLVNILLDALEER